MSHWLRKKPSGQRWGEPIPELTLQPSDSAAQHCGVQLTPVQSCEHQVGSCRDRVGTLSPQSTAGPFPAGIWLALS